MSDKTYICDSDGNDINPATVESQEAVLDIMTQSTDVNSDDWGTQKITLDVNGLGVGDNQACRECFISFQATNDVFLAVKDSGNATADDFLLPPNIINKLPVRNTSQIKLYGTAADLIYLMWRN